MGNRSLVEGQGSGRGGWGPEGRNCRSPESQGLSWKSDMMKTASGVSPQAQLKAFPYSSWKPPARSSQQCGSTQPCVAQRAHL